MKFICLRYVIEVFHGKTMEIGDVQYWDDEITPQLLDLRKVMFFSSCHNEWYLNSGPDYKLLERGVILGSASMVMYAHEHRGGYTRPTAATHTAIRYNQMEMLELLIKLGSRSWSDYAETAIECDRQEIFNMMVKKGARRWNSFLVCAARKGNLDVITMAISKKVTTSYHEALEVAIDYGQDEAAKLILTAPRLNITDFDKYISKAILLNRREIANLLMDRGVRDHNLIAEQCIYMGNVELLKRATITGTGDCSRFFYAAAEGGELELLRALGKHAEIAHWNRAMQIAVDADGRKRPNSLKKPDNTNVIRYLASRGADNWRVLVNYNYSREYIYNLPWKTEVAVEIWAQLDEEQATKRRRIEGMNEFLKGRLIIRK